MLSGDLHRLTKGVFRLARIWVTLADQQLSPEAENLCIVEMHAMSDRELKDMGVSRAQIEFAVRGERSPQPISSRYY